MYDALVVDPVYDRWAAYLHRLWSTDPGGVRTVLDVCCGTGLLGAELVALGYRVDGVDAAPAMLEVARARLGPEAVLVCEALPALSLPGPYDAAVSTFDGLNYLAPAELRATLAGVAGALRPDGWCVFDLHTDAALQFMAAHPVIEGEDQQWAFALTSSVDEAARTCRTRIDVAGGDGGAFAEEHLQFFHADDDVRVALADAGLELIALVDEYTDSPATADTLRATWVARRVSGG